MSSALTFNGRAADGRGYVDAAMRVDPGWTDWRRYLAGLAYFGMGRFEDAVASLEKIDPKSAGHWTNFYGLILQLSADGHLGRTADYAVVEEKLKQVLREDNQPAITGLMAQNHFPYKNHTDTERMLEGFTQIPTVPKRWSLPSPLSIRDGRSREAIRIGERLADGHTARRSAKSFEGVVD